MKACCVQEAKRHITRGRDVATCDKCGTLLLGYDNETDYQRAVDALTQSGTDFEPTRQGKLWVIAKQRRGPQH